MDTTQCASIEYRIGQPLGSYIILRHLAEGGYGTVYLGQHRYLKTFAAIKIANKQMENGDRQRFLAEARIAATLVHPNIIRLLDFGIDQDQAYLIMDFAPNSTMGQRYPFGTQLSPTIVVQRVKEVSAALQYMHSKNLIHCDIKPENMLLDVNNHILLCDFGITIFANRTTFNQLITGTVTYIAPEQLMGHPCFASDQYSLAVAAYGWLCGEPLFKGSTEQIALHHLSTPPPLLREKVPALAPAIEEVIHMALSKQPEQRFASVEVFAQKFAEASSTQNRVAAFSLPPEGDGNRIILPAPGPTTDPTAPRRPGSRMATPRELIKMLLLDLLIGSVVLILLGVLGIPVWTFWFYVMLCMGTLPLSIYIQTKNTIMSRYTALSLLIAFVFGISFQSLSFFEFVYIILLCLGTAAMVAARLSRTEANH